MKAGRTAREDMRSWFGRPSERLPQREMKLKTADALQFGRSRAEQQLLIGAVIPEEPRRIGAEGKVEANGADRCAIADSEAAGLHGVIEVLQIVLVIAQAEGAQIRVDVPHIMEQHATDIVPDQRKPEFLGIEEIGGAADGEAGLRVWRPGLISRAASLAVRAS